MYKIPMFTYAEQTIITAQVVSSFQFEKKKNF